MNGPMVYPSTPDFSSPTPTISKVMLESIIAPSPAEIHQPPADVIEEPPGNNNSPTPPTESGGNQSRGALLGLIVGIVIAVVIVLIAVFVFIRRRRRKKKREEDTEFEAGNNVGPTQVPKGLFVCFFVLLFCFFDKF